MWYLSVKMQASSLNPNSKWCENLTEINSWDNRWIRLVMTLQCIDEWVMVYLVKRELFYRFEVIKKLCCQFIIVGIKMRRTANILTEVITARLSMLVSWLVSTQIPIASNPTAQSVPISCTGHVLPIPINPILSPIYSLCQWKQLALNLFHR